MFLRVTDPRPACLHRHYCTVAKRLQMPAKRRKRLTTAKRARKGSDKAVRAVKARAPGKSRPKKAPTKGKAKPKPKPAPKPKRTAAPKPEPPEKRKRKPMPAPKAPPKPKPQPKPKP